MADVLTPDFDDLVGVPWKDRGREADGCDCWGLVRLAYARIGVELPSYSEDYRDTCDARGIVRLVGGEERAAWTRVEDHRPMDVVLMRERPWHVGLVIRRGLMLHMPEASSSVVEPYTTGRHGRRVEGVYRHFSLAG